MSLTLIVTDAGRAALVAAHTAGTLPVTLHQVGLSETAHVAAQADVALPGEIGRVVVTAGDAISADTIHVTAADDGGTAYDLRSIALYLADGTLFALYGQADPIVSKPAEITLLLAADVTFADIDVTDLTFGATNFADGSDGSNGIWLGERKTFYRKVAETSNYKFPNGQHLPLPAYQTMADALAGDPFLAADAADKDAHPGKWFIADDGTYLAMPDWQWRFERIGGADLGDGVARPTYGQFKANQNKSHTHTLPESAEDAASNGVLSAGSFGAGYAPPDLSASGGDEAVPDHGTVWVLVRVR